MDFVIPADYKEIKEIEKRDKYLDLARELKKVMEHESDGDTIYNWCVWNGPQKFPKGTGRIENRRSALLRLAREDF